MRCGRTTANLGKTTVLAVVVAVGLSDAPAVVAVGLSDAPVVVTVGLSDAPLLPIAKEHLAKMY